MFGGELYFEHVKFCKWCAKFDFVLVFVLQYGCFLYAARKLHGLMSLL